LGLAYDSLDADQKVAEAYLHDLKADPERGKQLGGWS
jgi:hypothetical protein